MAHQGAGGGLADAGIGVVGQGVGQHRPAPGAAGPMAPRAWAAASRTSGSPSPLTATASTGTDARADGPIRPKARAASSRASLAPSLILAMRSDVLSSWTGRASSWSVPLLSNRLSIATVRNSDPSTCPWGTEPAISGTNPSVKRSHRPGLRRAVPHGRQEGAHRRASGALGRAPSDRTGRPTGPTVPARHPSQGEMPDSPTRASFPPDVSHGTMAARVAIDTTPVRRTRSAIPGRVSVIPCIRASWLSLFLYPGDLRPPWIKIGGGRSSATPPSRIPRVLCSGR